METTELHTECRICLVSKNDSNFGFYIHLNSSSGLQPLQPILLNLTGIDFFKHKDISSWICDQCENKLVDFDRFRKKCCESNDVFLKRAGIQTTLNEKPNEFEINLLERLERLYAKNIRIKRRVKHDSVKVDFIEKEKDLSENDVPKEEEESGLSLLERLEKIDPKEEQHNNVATQHEEVSDLSLLERLEKIISNEQQHDHAAQHKEEYIISLLERFEKEHNAAAPKPEEESHLDLLERLEKFEKEHNDADPMQKEESDLSLLIRWEKIDTNKQHNVAAPKQEEKSDLGLLERLEIIDNSDKKAAGVQQMVDPVKIDLIEKEISDLSTKNTNSLRIPPTFEDYQSNYMCPLKDVCTKHFQRDIHLMEHLNIDHPTLTKQTPFKKYECTICYKVLRHQISLEAHIVSSHIRYCCNKCKQFFRDNEIPIHNRSCQQETKTKMNMETNKQNINHPVTVQMEPSVIKEYFEKFYQVYICLHCPTTFELASSLREHLHIEHPNLKKSPFVNNVCEFCCRVLLNEMALESHIASKHIQHCCKKCNNFFKDNDVRNHQNYCPVEMKMKNVEKTTELPLKEDTTKCRTCLATTKEERSFIDLCLSTNYPEMFLCCTGIDIKSIPRMTTWMCSTCEDKLTGFYNFQRKCWKSDFALRMNLK